MLFGVIFPVLIALVIDVLKFVGVVGDGVAGKLQASANLLVLLAVAVAIRWYPDVDIYKIDMDIAAFVQIASILFAYVVQVITSKQVHNYMSNVLGLPFSYSAGTARA